VERARPDGVAAPGVHDGGAGVALHGSRRRCTRNHKNNYFTEMCSGSEEGWYLRLIDVCITQL